MIYHLSWIPYVELRPYMYITVSKNWTQNQNRFNYSRRFIGEVKFARRKI